MITFQEFLNKYNGQTKVGNTPENTGECVGLVAVWIDNLGLPHVWGHARDLINNCDKSAYEVEYNTPTGVPKKGDIIVWSSAMGGGYGHTAISTGTGNVNTFEVFEQNNPTGSNCHLRTYPNYNNVIGWFRPKAVVPPIDYKKLYEASLQKIGDLQATEKRLREEIALKDKAIDDRNKVITERDATITTLTTKLSQIKALCP
jgi:surface antigen